VRTTTALGRRGVFAGVTVLALLLAACGDDDDDGAAEDTTAEDTTAAPDATEAPEDTGGAETTTAGGETGGGNAGDFDYAGASGEVFFTGSSTVEPISIIVGERVGELSDGNVAVSGEGPGTGDGFQKFCAGEADISDASRPISDEEIALCEEAGIEYTEIEVGIDGLSVITNPNNADVACLDVPALYALFGPESEGFANWSDANDLATELGSAYTTLPDSELVIYGPGEESGTYDTFVEFVVADFAEERGTEEVTRADYTATPNDNEIVGGIEGADSALGWVGYAFYAGQGEALKAIEIDAGDGCVAPTPETIADGSYGFSRSLYIYVNNASFSENPGVQAFVNYYVSEAGLVDAVTEGGYVSLPDDRATASQDAAAGIAAG
jgi:phosphate transport system substrate-binding protein